MKLLTPAQTSQVSAGVNASELLLITTVLFGASSQYYASIVEESINSKILTCFILALTTGILKYLDTRFNPAADPHSSASTPLPDL